jgi:hypothetical protein
MSSHELIPLIKIILEKVTGPHLDEKFSHLTWNMMVHYCFHKSLLLVPVLCQMYPAHAFTSPIYASVFQVLSFIKVFPPQLLGREYKSCSSALRDFLQPPGTPFYFPNILLCILCLKTLNSCPSFNVRDQVLQPCTTGILKFALSYQMGT